jgi:hypothetical protein
MESRLDRMLARLLTQRACLNHAATLIESLPGVVLELGLGKGRTWSHLCALFPRRDIHAFDHGLHAPEDLTPPEGHLILGDLHDTLPAAMQRFGGNVALIHADIGTADGEGELGASDRELARMVGAAAADLVTTGGVLLGDREMCAEDAAAFERLPTPDADLPDGIAPWPYYLCRRR